MKRLLFLVALAALIYRSRNTKSPAQDGNHEQRLQQSQELAGHFLHQSASYLGQAADFARLAGWHVWFLLKNRPTRLVRLGFDSLAPSRSEVRISQAERGGVTFPSQPVKGAVK